MSLMFRKFLAEDVMDDPQPRTGCAGVVHLCCDLGVSRIDPEADLHTAFPCHLSVFLKLIEGIEYDGVGILQYLPDFFFVVCRSEGVNLFFEFLISEPGFIETTGTCSVQIFAHHGKGGKGGICF